MNIPLLVQLVEFVESLFRHHAPEVVAAASSPAVQQAVEQAVVSAAVATASQDPKVQAGIAAYKALQEFKAAINPPPPEPRLVSGTAVSQ